MSDVDDEEHFLSPYLSRRLPELGLDYETYGPYCLGAVGCESSSSSDGGDDGGRDDDCDELDGIIDLLRSSSETHSDDAAAWSDLRAEIIRRTGEWRRAAEVRKRQEAQGAKEAEEERIRQAKAEAEAYEEVLREKKAHHGVAPEEEEKMAQRDALLNRFAYEKEEEDGDNEGGPVSNKDAAAEAQRESAQKAREQSSKSRDSKAEARQKNKEAMKLKADKKEERRKKATKGERKR